MVEREVSDFESWRKAARDLIRREVPPPQIRWREPGEAQLALPLGDAEDEPAETHSVNFSVPQAFLRLAKHVACHRDPKRWELLYQALWRIAHGERHLLEVQVDEVVHELRRIDQVIRRDIHKMHAFVRFEKQLIDGREEFLAYFRPDHKIFRLAAPFFVERFRSMRWTIFGPDETATWDGERLEFLPGAPDLRSGEGDELTQLWRSYYASTFNPNRLNTRLMRREMPQRFWPLLPEAADIEQLVAQAPARAEAQVQAGILQGTSPRSAKPFLPASRDIASLLEAARGCQGCTLHASATQTVFGEGRPDARIVFVGEQPGDQEDLAGRPFVGPAGQIFDELLVEAGIARQDCYVTNTVKHFKWVPRGKRRLHAKPSAREVYACRPWLEAELETIAPQLLVLLGATAAQAILGPQFRIQRERGEPRTSPWCDWTLATYHPSAILKAGDTAHALQVREALLTDLKLAAAELKKKEYSNGQEESREAQDD